MSLWRHLGRGFRALFHRRATDQEIADEVEQYLEAATAAGMASGLNPDEARRAARLEVGNLTVTQEQVRSYGWENLIEELLTDLRYGARRLRSNPGFATVAVLTLALGIGASTAIFSAVNPVLFEPLPYPRSNRIMAVWDRNTDGSRQEVTFGTYRELAERSRSFDAVAALKPWQPTLTGPAEPERLGGLRVSAGYFRVLGVQPAVGRDFLDSDDQVNGPAVVVLSDGLWRRRFGAAGGMVGSQITLNGTPYTVIGVMPAGFENVLASSAEVWAPLQYDRSLPPEGREWGHHLRMVGRLHSGIDVDDVGWELDLIARTPVSDFTRKPWASLSTGVVVNPLHDDVIRAVKPALLAILGAVVLLLAIAGVNVTNMLLARGAQRRGEFAMRAALGAERVRLLRQLLTESLLLSVLGGAIGMLVAQAGVRAFVALSPAELPRAAAIQVDGAVFLFALGTVTLIGLLVGLIPAVQAGHSDPHLTLRESARSSVGSHQLTRRALVVSEIALAVMLLLGAGLLFRSLGRLFAITPGFDPSRLLTMQVQTSGGQFEDDISTHRFFDQALDAVRQVPGVEAAAFTSQLPLSGDFEKYGVQFESNPDISANDDQSAFRYAVSPGYFETMGIPLRQGRLLEAPDQQEGPIGVLLNESLARRRFPGQDPIGQRLHLGSTDQPWYTVVGVVGDVKQASLEVTQGDAVYLPALRWYFSDKVRSLVVRVRGDAEALVPSIKNAIWSVDKDQPIVRIATMDHLLAQSAAERHFAFLLFQAFALAALILAAIGIYGVLSGSVTERIREIGVRSALGATRQNILGLVIRQGMSLTGLGVVIGLAAAVAASRAIVSLLFGVSRLDPITHLGVIALLASVSLIACWIPAWRAARVDPSITLRTE